ncbi:MAG TPA: PqqD family protein [Gemmatimonadaceae bacterium]|nr:PqqD family protein [Gemmatimonadaceae bacterium]
MTRYRIATDALAATLSDGAVLLHLETKRYYTLNETGMRVWVLLEQGNGVDDIVRTLVAEFEVEPDAARREVDRLLEDLIRERLVEPV